MSTQTVRNCYLFAETEPSLLKLIPVKKSRPIAPNGTPSQSYMYAHTALTPARQAGARFTYRRGMEG